MRTAGFFTLIALLYLPLTGLAADSCVGSVARTLTQSPVSSELLESVKKAGRVLGRPLTSKQEVALEKAISMERQDVYTASEVAKINKMLAKAGFKEDEVEKLRLKGVLGKNTIAAANGSPTGVVFQSLPLKEFDSNVIRDLQKNKPYTYFIDQNGNIHLAEQGAELPSDQILVLSSSGDSLGAGKGTFVIHEAGDVSFDSADKSFKFKARYGFDHDQIADEDLLKKASEATKGHVEHTPMAKNPSSRLLKCLDVVSAQSGAKNFVLDRMISDNAVTTVAIASSELSGAGRLKTAEGRQIIASDIIGGNVTGLIGTAVAKKMIVKNSGFASSMAVRAGMGLSMIQVQKGVSSAMVDQKPEDNTVDDIARFNRAHFVARLPVNYAIDQFMVKSLPTMVFNTCQKHPTMSLAVSPKAVRFYERYASSTIYYGLRQATIGH